MERILRITKREKKVRQGYAVAFLLMVIAYLVTFYANRQLIRQSRKVDHTNKVILDLEKLISKIKDAETGVRGYLISKDPEFLLPYYGSASQADSLFLIVKSRTTDNSLQQQRLERLKRNLDKRMGLLRELMDSFEFNNLQVKATSRPIMLESKQRMDAIRSDVFLLQADERALLEQRAVKLDNLFTAVGVITIVSLVFAFLLIVFGFMTYARENKAKKIAGEEIIKYQEQLKHRIEELNRVNAELIRMRSQEKFAATGRIARTIAHEVRNPLTNINLAAEQLRSELVRPDENTTFLFEMIERNSQRINQLISDLLNSTKFSELQYGNIPVNDLLDEALHDARDRITLTNVEVKRLYERSACIIAADRSRLRIALLNIIINALEAMEGQENGELLLETRKGEGKCRIRISDNGKGMDAESLQRVFEPYFTSKQQGNGLGLTNTQNIILNHKGEIFVESEPGKGTSFIILIGLAPEAS